MDRDQRDRDLVLSPGQFADVLDETKGNVTVYVGPNKVSLAQTDRPVRYDADSRRFTPVILDESIQEFYSAREGQYVELQNPAADNVENAHPTPGSSNHSPKLEYGRKVNIPGPISFPLWPGQSASVIEGHQLRSNQYLIVRVYNEQSAKENWGQGIVIQKDSDSGTSKDLSESKNDLSMGKLVIIRGTDISFYIPPTGIEVLRDENGEYVRDAVSLERLDYCILLDENGNKRYVRGPEVVFPKPTEKFVEYKGTRIFRALELNDDMGIHIKVIAPYDELDEGNELFLKGTEQKIYFPRQEHSIIKYGDQKIHYATALPAGDARYILEKSTGKVALVPGPKMLLPDPRKEVIVRKILSDKEVELMYPGNEDAKLHNRKLRGLKKESEKFIEESTLESANVSRSSRKRKSLNVDSFERKTTYTQPKSITLDNKFDGAVAVNIWPGYAVMVVDKTDGRRVEQGPKNILLEYDESLQPIRLSTGKPKTTDKIKETVYLMKECNKVSDIVEVVTKDMVSVKIKLSYRVNFEGDPNKWFNVENYVKFLCDHLRSRLKNMAKRHGIESLNDNHIDMIRDTILGIQEEGKRTGCLFEENGMKVYDLEVLDFEIGDTGIADMLAEQQHHSVRNALQIARKKQELSLTQQREDINRQIAEAELETNLQQLKHQKIKIDERLEVKLTELQSDIKTANEKLTSKLAEQDSLKNIHEANLLRQKLTADQDLEIEQLKLEQKLTALKAEVEAVVEKSKAISPQLVSALQSLADRHIAGEAVKGMAPLSILEDDSISNILEKVLGSTGAMSVVKKMISPKKSSSDNDNS